MNIKETGDYFCEDHLSDETIALYVDAMLQNKENNLPPIVLEHVENCLQCKKNVFAIYEINKNNADSIENNSPELKNNTGNFLRIAATLILIIGIGYLLYNIIGNHQTKTTPITDFKSIENQHKVNSPPEKDSATTTPQKSLPGPQIKQNELALNTRESEMFEGLINSSYRSNEVEITSPRLNQLFSPAQSVLFQFKTDNPSTYMIKLYNNKGEKIFQSEAFSNTSYPLRKKLPIGLYYWKLEMQEDLLYVGKIFVK
jgi:hypothetical protein